jgi:predicted phage-related endonuclease
MEKSILKANEAQGTESWLRIRHGRFTASRASDLMAKTKSGPSTSRANLIALLACERLTETPMETYQNDAMRRGLELEAEARDMYSFTRGVVVEECGFIPLEPNAGCSPDGLVGEDGLVELKCPSAMAKHVSALRSGDHAQEYRWQLQHQLMTTGRKWVDAASYDPRFPEGLQLAVVRVYRDESAIAELAAEIAKAEIEVQALVAELLSLRDKLAEAA